VRRACLLPPSLLSSGQTLSVYRVNKEKKRGKKRWRKRRSFVYIRTFTSTREREKKERKGVNSRVENRPLSSHLCSPRRTGRDKKGGKSETVVHGLLVNPKETSRAVMT